MCMSKRYQRRPHPRLPVLQNTHAKAAGTVSRRQFRSFRQSLPPKKNQRQSHLPNLQSDRHPKRQRRPNKSLRSSSLSKLNQSREPDLREQNLRRYQALLPINRLHAMPELLRQGRLRYHGQLPLLTTIPFITAEPGGHTRRAVTSAAPTSAPEAASERREHL